MHLSSTFNCSEHLLTNFKYCKILKVFLEDDVSQDRTGLVVLARERERERERIYNNACSVMPVSPMMSECIEITTQQPRYLCKIFACLFTESLGRVHM